MTLRKPGLIINSNSVQEPIVSDWFGYKPTKLCTPDSSLQREDALLINKDKETIYFITVWACIKKSIYLLAKLLTFYRVKKFFR